MKIEKINYKILFLISAVFVISMLIMYITNAKYTLSEISADNFNSKLKRNSSSLLEAGLDQCIPEKFSLYFAKDYLTSDNFQSNGLQITNNKTLKGNHVEIHSIKTNLNYWIDFDEKNMTNLWIFKQALLDPNSPPTLFIKDIIDKLILNEGFLLKRTELKNGTDIIIKETKDCFIIGSFHSYDDTTPVPQIMFSTYNKNKYF